MAASLLSIRRRIISDVTTARTGRLARRHHSTITDLAKRGIVEQAGRGFALVASAFTVIAIICADGDGGADTARGPVEADDRTAVT